MTPALPLLLAFVGADPPGPVTAGELAALAGLIDRCEVDVEGVAALPEGASALTSMAFKAVAVLVEVGGEVALLLPARLAVGAARLEVVRRDGRRTPATVARIEPALGLASLAADHSASPASLGADAFGGSYARTREGPASARQVACCTRGDGDDAFFLLSEANGPIGRGLFDRRGRLQGIVYDLDGRVVPEAAVREFMAGRPASKVGGQEDFTPADFR